MKLKRDSGLLINCGFGRTILKGTAFHEECDNQVTGTLGMRTVIRSSRHKHGNMTSENEDGFSMDCPMDGGRALFGLSRRGCIL